MQSIFRHGQMELQRGSVASAAVVLRGDLVMHADSTDKIEPASNLAWTTDHDTTQQAFANVFYGVAYEASAATETDDISVDVSAMSVYEFDVTSDTYEANKPVGVAQNTASLERLENQLLEDPQTANAGAIGYSYELKTAAVTRLHVKLASAFNVAANNTNATVG